MARLFSEIWNNEIALFFAICIGIVFIVFAFGLRSEKTRPFARQAPGILTSLGILGTFYGIFIGLLDFNFDNIEESIKPLLNGLKTAFSTSILGLFSAIVFKLIIGYLSTRSDSKAGDDEENLPEAINNLTKAVAENKNNERETLKAIEKLTDSIVGNNEGSLLGQIGLLRNNINDGFRAQKEAFDKFAEQVAQSGAEALIEALEKVIKDFNEKISEQFGENFKQLNDGVGKLLEWQERMKEAMELAVASIDRSKDSLEQSKDIMGEVQRSLVEAQESLEKIEASTASIPAHAEKMSEMLTMLGEQTSVLTESLGTFAQLQEKAVGAIPLVEQNLTDISSGIQNSIQQMQTNWEEAMDTMHSSQKNQVEKMEKEFTKMLGVVKEGLGKTKGGMDDAIAKTIEIATANLSAMAKKLAEDYGEFLQTVQKITNLIASSKDGGGR